MCVCVLVTPLIGKFLKLTMPLIINGLTSVHTKIKSASNCSGSRKLYIYIYMYVRAYIRYMCIYAYTYLIGPDLLFEGGAIEVRAENAKEEGIFSPPTPEPKTILG